MKANDLLLLEELSADLDVLIDRANDLSQRFKRKIKLEKHKNNEGCNAGPGK